MRENRTSGSEGGGTTSELPTPIDLKIAAQPILGQRDRGGDELRICCLRRPLGLGVIHNSFMVTLKDIAARVGVDVSTVSKVLQGAPIRISESRREEIVRVAKEMDYRPNLVARGLRLRRADAIALVVPSTTSYVYPEIIDGAEDAAEEHGYALFLVKSLGVDLNDRLLSVVGHGRIDGLIFVDTPSCEFAANLTAKGVPFVRLNRSAPKDRGYVALDDEAGFAAQAAYLAGLGHREIAFVAGELSSYVQTVCIAGFRKGLSKHRLALADDRILECDFEGEAADAVAEQLLRLSPKPTAVASSSVLTASRIVQAFRARSVRVPEDISVIGYHDSPAALWPPPGITTVKMPSREQGRRGVECLLKLLNGEAFDRETVQGPLEIIERGTTAPLP